MNNKLKLIGNLRCKSELILAEKIKRMSNGLIFAVYTIIKDRHGDNIGRAITSESIQVFISHYPSDLKYTIIDQDNNILFKNFTLDNDDKIKQLEERVEKLENELDKNDEIDPRYRPWG